MPQDEIGSSDYDEFDDVEEDNEERQIEEYDDVEEEKTEEKPEAESKARDDKQTERKEQKKEKVAESVDPRLQGLFNVSYSTMLKALGEDKSKEAAESAAEMAKGLFGYFNDITGKIQSIEDSAYNNSEYGNAYKEMKAAMPSITKEAVKEWVDYRNRLVIEKGQENRSGKNVRVDKDTKEILSGWGMKEDDMAKELKRYEKLHGKVSVQELGRIPI